MTVEDRFFNKVKIISGCWMWQASTDGKGYGLFRIGTKLFKAHRWSYAYHNGENPGKKQVCHSCDIPGCVNPEHLFLGTNYENSMDMLNKGRFYNQKKSQCPQGHAYDLLIQTNSGLKRERRCRECMRQAVRRYRAKRKIDNVR